MAKKKGAGKNRSIRKKENSLKEALSLYSKLADLKRQIDSISEEKNKSEDRIADLEVHVNLLTRLLTTLCIEKLGLRIGVLKRLVRRVEQEAVRDSQILELESLYKLPLMTHKKAPLPPAKPKEDPWDQIS